MVSDAPKSLFEGNGPFSTLSSKIDVAYALGLLSSEERRELHLLRKIRNEFAHAVDHEISFDSPKLRDWSRALAIPDRGGGSTLIEDFGDSSNRSRFVVSVSVINFLISEMRVDKAVKPKSPRFLRSH